MIIKTDTEGRVRFATRALDEEFLKRAKGGLLIIHDGAKRTIHLGWIEEAIRLNNHIGIRLGLTVAQDQGKKTWDRFKDYFFEIPDIGDYNALEDSGGFLCADTVSRGPTFRIYPADSISGDCVRDHGALIAYGKKIS